MITLRQYFLLAFAILVSASNVSLCMNTKAPNEPLYQALPEKLGSKNITIDTLLGLNRDYMIHAINWVDKDHLVFSEKPIATKRATVQIVNIRTGKKNTLAQGFGPIASPDGRWIAYWQYVDRIDKRSPSELALELEPDARLCIIKPDGTSARIIKDNIAKFSGGYGAHFAWSPDSKSIAIAHQPYISPYISTYGLKANPNESLKIKVQL